MVTRRKLVKDLLSKGIFLNEHGGRHAKLINPTNHHTAPLPRHTEIAPETAKEIYDQIGLKHPAK